MKSENALTNWSRSTSLSFSIPIFSQISTSSVLFSPTLHSVSSISCLLNLFPSFTNNAYMVALSSAALSCFLSKRARIMVTSSRSSCFLYLNSSLIWLQFEEEAGKPALATISSREAMDTLLVSGSTKLSKIGLYLSAINIIIIILAMDIYRENIDHQIYENQRQKAQVDQLKNFQWQCLKRCYDPERVYSRDDRQLDPRQKDCLDHCSSKLLIHFITKVA